MGELGYGEDVDEVEEQLQGRDPLLTAVPSAQHPPMVEPLHRVRLPVSCQCATARILSPAVGISYRLNGQVFRTVTVGWGIAHPKNTPIVDSDRGCANRHGQHVDEQSACNFGETPRGELRSTPLPRTWVHRG